MFSEASQEYLAKKRLRGRKTKAQNWNSIKKMQEHKLNLECENLKKKSGKNEYEKAIALLNDTLGKLQIIDPDMVAPHLVATSNRKSTMN
jgi:ketosteroid isomerase-like protein